jgi:hypothetical protein
MYVLQINLVDKHHPKCIAAASIDNAGTLHREWLLPSLLPGESLYSIQVMQSRGHLEEYATHGDKQLLQHEHLLLALPEMTTDLINYPATQLQGMHNCCT